MTIESIELKNFQAHKSGTFPLSPGITTIRGATDRGKSSILRALRWACLNDLGGEEFIREGAKLVTVSLHVGGKLLVREKGRGGSTNTYGLDGKLFRAFGTGLPTEAGTLLNVGEINFQSQHDAPFWFSETAGEVSRRLNAVIDLSVIDTALAHTAAAVRQAQERRNVSLERKQAVEWDLEKAEEDRDRIKEFKTLKGLHAKREELKEDFDTLEALLERMREHRVSVRDNEAQAEEGKALLALARRRMLFGRQVVSLKRILADIAESEALSMPPPSFAPVSDAWSRREEARRNVRDLSALIEKAEAAKKQADGWAETALGIEKRFHARTKGEACPLCGQRMG